MHLRYAWYLRSYGVYNPYRPLLFSVKYVDNPLLLTVFINDLPQCIHFATSYIFADDTKCLHSIATELQDDINSISSWSDTSNLLFNESKFNHLCFWKKPTMNISTYTVNQLVH